VERHKFGVAVLLVMLAVVFGRPALAGTVDCVTIKIKSSNVKDGVLYFGKVPVGQTASDTVTVRNTDEHYSADLDAFQVMPSPPFGLNNAGGTFAKTVVTSDGLESTFALNVMAPFVLTESLMPALSAARGRVINVVTALPRGARATLAQLTGPRASAGLGGYTRAKLALATLTREQARRHAASGVTFRNCCQYWGSE